MILEENKGITKKTIRYAETTDLNDDEQWLIKLSANLSCLIGDFVNTIDTGRPNGQIRGELFNRWHIQNLATFETTMFNLAIDEKRHTYLARFNVIKRFYDLIDNTNILCRLFSRHCLSFALSWYQFRTREDLKKTIPLLEFEKGIANNKNSQTFKQMLRDAKEWLPMVHKNLGDYHQINSLISWDAVNMVYLTRYAVQVGIIERSDFLKFVKVIKKQVQKHYASWQEVTIAYAISSLLWKYTPERANIITHNLASLLAKRRPSDHLVAFK